MQTLKPTRLKPGDTIGIVAPCLPVLPSFRENYERGKAVLEDMGFKLKEGKTISLQHGYSAGTPKQQAADINVMFADPAVKALISASGGHTAIGVLEHLDYPLIHKNPKPFIGMSDMTSFHLALYAQTGLVGFHMDEVIWGIGWNWAKDEFKDAGAIKQLFPKVLTQTEPLGSLPHLNQWESWRDGIAEGHLIGGTLPLLANQVGTPYFPDPKTFDGAILFWEATGRAKYDMRRALFQLKYYGVFERISGMVIGTLTDFKPLGEEEITEPEAKDIIMEVVKDYDFPIMVGLDFGHYTVNLPMPLGIRARFNAQTLNFELVENAVS